MNNDPPSLSDAYRDRSVLLVGGTGFLGSVTLSLLLHHLPALARVYVLVRKRPGISVEERFFERILPGEAFTPLRERFGDRFDDLVREKVTVLEGDIARELLGLDEAVLTELHGLDLVLNCSGLVDFHAPLDQAYRVNILGTRNLLSFCERTGAALLHTSTAFVAGERGGRTSETVESGDFPLRENNPYLHFDAEREITDLSAELERIRAEAASQRAQADFADRGVRRFREVNGVDPNEEQRSTAARRVERDQLRENAVDAGRRRAAFWGWPNVYTYSKAIGERLISASPVRSTIVRPSIIESALAYPVAGWNQNATTSAPLVMLGLAGFRPLPASADHVLDLIPVDQVAWGIVVAGAAILRGEQQPVYQIGTSDCNPCTMGRIADLIGIHAHEQALEEGGSRLRRFVKANREPKLTSDAAFRRRTEWTRRIAGRLADEAERWGGRIQHPHARRLLTALKERADDTLDDLGKAADLWNVFLPFSHDLAYRFETRNIRALAEASANSEDPVRFDPAGIDWRTYWLEVHIPGLKRWVWGDAPAGRGVKTIPSATSLLNRIAGIARRDGHRQALSYATSQRPFALTYRELWTAAGRVADTLSRSKLAEDATLGVVADPTEPWPVALMAALRTEHSVVIVPVRAWRSDRSAAWTSGVGGYLRMVGRDRVRIFEAGGEKERAAASVRVSFLDESRGEWESGEWLDGRGLARRLAEVGQRLGLSDRDRCLLVAPATHGAESDAAAWLLLATLHHGASVDVVTGNELVDTMADLSPTLIAAEPNALHVVAGSEPPTLDRVVKLAAAGSAGTLPLLAKRVDILRVYDEEAADGHTPFRPRHARSVLSKPDPDGRGIRVLVMPDLDGADTVQTLYRKLRADVLEHNANAPLKARISAVALTLNSDDQASDDSAGTPLWTPVRRHGHADADGDLDARAQRSAALLADAYTSAEMALFVDQLHAEPLTGERLDVWERTLLRGVREGGLHGQAFLQRFAAEISRRRRPERRLARRAGTFVEHVRGWAERDDPEEALLPEPVSDAVRAGLGHLGHAFYRHGLRVTVHGTAYLPTDRNFIVVGNHSSHLDGGLVKYALGPWGKRLHTLAARDYFFGTPARRFVSRHFTRLVPTDRQRVSSAWLRRARELLADGDCVLIFPEGTRTETPEVKEFKGSLGTLVRTARVPVLPVYIENTGEVLPKGRAVPKGRRVTIHVGPPVPTVALERRAGEAGTLRHDRALAAALQDAVAAVPEGRFWWLDDEGGTERLESTEAPPLPAPEASRP